MADLIFHPDLDDQVLAAADEIRSKRRKSSTQVESSIPLKSNLMCETLSTQIDGDHYKKMGIQPWEIIAANGLDYWEGAALKYLLRWRVKDGIIDLDKIIHYVQHIKALALAGHYEKKENGV